MTEEIKEILYLENYVDKYKSDEKAIIKGNRLTTPAMLDYLEVKDLLNYITNLQKKNEELKKEIEHYKIMFSNYFYEELYPGENEEDDIYKQRNEKAVEYIKQHCDRPGRLLLPKIDFNYNDLLNILQGGDE